MKNKLLVICGPTSTGKTNLALNIAKIFSGELISADSRQVYKSLDIGTGKDIPENFNFCVSDLKFRNKKIGYYTDGKISIWGYDLADTREEFSISSYFKITEKIVSDLIKRSKLPVFVGGSGLYIRAVVDGINTIEIPKDTELRKSLQGKGVNELYEILRICDPFKTGAMNRSDIKNPRRLIRAIELSKYEIINKYSKKPKPSMDFDILEIGLNAPKEIIAENINKRVDARLQKGIENEIERLFKFGVSWDDQSMNTIGYKEWKDYFLGCKPLEEVVNSWQRDERKYAKRQMTWFKKDQRIIWFDVSQNNWKDEVENVIGKWYKNK
jgi:tRNA dimethylallyltransferase